jgi:arabinan endo-1,5-alpha-L-arabinosidase
VGESVWKLRVEQGRDWEQSRATTLLLTGLDEVGMAVWGKKIE